MLAELKLMDKYFGHFSAGRKSSFQMPSIIFYAVFKCKMHLTLGIRHSGISTFRLPTFRLSTICFSFSGAMWHCKIKTSAYLLSSVIKCMILSLLSLFMCDSAVFSTFMYFIVMRLWLPVPTIISTLKSTSKGFDNHLTFVTDNYVPVWGNCLESNPLSNVGWVFNPFATSVSF